MSFGHEFTTVDRPFTEQLLGIRWKLVTRSLCQRSVTGCKAFRKVLAKSDLCTAIERINLSDAEPWIDEARLSQAVSAPEITDIRSRVSCTAE